VRWLRLEDGVNILFHIQFAENACFLSEVSHPKPGAFEHGQGSDVFAVEYHFTAIGRNLSRGHAKAGGFASAIGAKQPYDLACIDLKAYAVNDLARTVVLDQALNFEDGHQYLSRAVINERPLYLEGGIGDKSNGS
jgi:hypothetical protein